MRFLIIGGNGQLGSAIRVRLEARGHTVFVVSSDLPQQNYNDFFRFVWNSDFVFFLAFRAGGARYLRDKQFGFDFIHENLKLMETVFKALAETKVAHIYTSSQMSQMNYSAYGCLKRMAEFYTESLNGIYTRFWNIYGYERNPDRYHAICDFISMAKRDGYIKMLTTGQESRQFLYVDDAAEALLVCYDNFEKFRDAKTPLDITSFEWVTMMKVAQTIGELTGARVVQGTDKDWVQRDAKIEPDVAILDYWKPTTTLEKGLKNIIEAMP